MQGIAIAGACPRSCGKSRTEELELHNRRHGSVLPALGRSALGRMLVLLTAVALVGGCDTRGGKIPYDPAGFSAPDRIDAAESAYDMALGPLDVIRITVFRVPDLSGEYQVDGKGIVSLPLAGDISVRDKSATEFAHELEQIYGQKYLNNPDVTVRVMNTNQYNVTVEGSVNVPGVYQLPGRTTLLGAIALAHGLNTNEANPRRAAIFRRINGKMAAAAFDLIAVRRQEMENPIVYPGDIVVVEGSKTRSIYRDLLQTIPLIAVFRSL